MFVCTYWLEKGAGVGKMDARELNVEGGGGKAGIK